VAPGRPMGHAGSRDIGGAVVNRPMVAGRLSPGSATRHATSVAVVVDLAAVTVASEGGRQDDDLAARRPERHVASALILDRVARPLALGAGLAAVLRVVEAACVASASKEGRQWVGQCRDGALPGLEVFDGADHAPLAAFGFDLLLDILDLGPNLREANPRLRWGPLWRSPLAVFALGHGRSPRDGCVRKRPGSTLVM